MAPESKRGGKREGAGRKAYPRQHEEYAQVGGPPEDDLDKTRWAYRMVAQALHKAATDPMLTEKERRAEIRQTAKVLSALVPVNRLLEAESTIRDAAAYMTDKAAAAPEMQPEPEHHAEGKPSRAIRIDN